MDTASLYELFRSSAGVTTDSRQIRRGCIFFALKGPSFNGNLFAKDAIDNGAAYAVIDEDTNAGEIYRDRLIIVPDVLRTLQELSGYHRHRLNCPVLAITGSNGKTTTKELLAAVMRTKYKTVATAGNLNNHIGVPLTLLNTPSETEFLIVEMGANHQGEIAGYCEYADPHWGLITNIGKAHLEGFGGEEGVIKGKTELYAYIARMGGKLFVSSLSDILIKKAIEYVSLDRIVYYGNRLEDYCSGSNISEDGFLSVRVNGQTIKTQLIGAYNFENVMAAICIGKYFGVGEEQIINAIESYTPSNNRSQKLLRGSNTILLDAYNANPSSMAESLKNFEKLDATNKITILGEMMELGDYSSAEHIKITEMVDHMELSLRIYVGDGFSMVKGNSGVYHFDTTEQLKEWYNNQRFENTTQLIKGSRKNALEKILS